MHVVIFAGGTLQPGRPVDEAIHMADFIIAADSGATNALHYGCTPSIVVGDFDSLEGSELRHLQEQGCQIVQHAVEKDETDTELALLLAIKHGASSISLLGGLGGARFDHAIANIFLLTTSGTIPLRILDGPTICWLVTGPGKTVVQGQIGDLLSLFPLTQAAVGIHTHGLYYPLHAETLLFGRPRGISNVLTHDKAEISLEEGILLVIHTDKDHLPSMTHQEHFEPSPPHITS